MANKRGRKPAERSNYIIKMEDGTLIPVSKEVYTCWHSFRRQERYQKEKDNNAKICSLDEFLQEHPNNEQNVHLLENAQDSLVEQALNELMIERLRQEVTKLEKENRELLQAIYYNEMTLRECAKEFSISFKAVQKRRDAILRYLAKALGKN